MNLITKKGKKLIVIKNYERKTNSGVLLSSQKNIGNKFSAWLFEDDKQKRKELKDYDKWKTFLYNNRVIIEEPEIQVDKEVASGVRILRRVK